MNVNEILTSSGKYPNRPKEYPLNPIMKQNAEVLANRLTCLLISFGEEKSINSGYRPRQINEEIGGSAKNSHHIYCEAADLEDFDGRLARWCMDNLDLLNHFGLWMEHPFYTRTINKGESEKIPEGQDGWVHLQMVPPHSTHRVFIPYDGGPP